MTEPAIDRQLDQKIAAAELDRAALQFGATYTLAGLRDCTSEQLQAARSRLHACALLLCAAYSHPDEPRRI